MPSKKIERLIQPFDHLFLGFRKISRFLATSDIPQTVTLEEQESISAPHCMKEMA